MPIRTIDTRLGRLLECRRHRMARPGRPLPKGPTTPPEDEDRARAGDPFDEGSFDLLAVESEGGSHV